MAPPPGAAIVFFNDAPTSSAPRPPALDLSKFMKSSSKLETPYTPPISVMFALDVSLDIILSQGLGNYVNAHLERMNYLYSELEEIGFAGVPRPNLRSNTVGAFYSPVDPQAVISKLREHGYTISGGMWKIRDKSIRIGVMGDVTLDDVESVVGVLRNFMETAVRRS